MSDNNVDMYNSNNEVDDINDNGFSFWGWLLGLAGAGVLGFLCGNAGKKKAVDKAYKRGYNDAAEIFEKKYKLQHEAFVNQEKKWKEHEDEYLQLISDYEEYIEELQSEDEKKENLGKIEFFEDKLAELRKLEESS